MLKVPKVQAQQAAPQGAAAAPQRLPSEPDEMRAGRTLNLKQVLDATRAMPPAERARFQMQFLAYPEAWAKEKWLESPSDP
jgi:hypothetical protein